MKIKVGSSFLELVQGDITKQRTEAIVNAANERLAPGGGVAGAIHRAAGPELWEECKRLEGCRTGEAKITKGYRLPAHYVIHTVGPIYSGSLRDAELLEACYRNSLKLAVERRIKTVAFPAISTGAFGYPLEAAAETALKTTIDFLKQYDEIDLVRFILYDSNALRVHEKRLKETVEGDAELEPIEA
jgi:O-acetyl-ADP-ribose deacetylase (regulator of RNase III)